MIFFPAIDLYGGKVVRLTQGDYEKMKDYGSSPLDAAKAFKDAGCANIHVVDLEGARAGEPKHLDVLSRIASLGMFVQYGGGLRTQDAVSDALSFGAGRVMAGSLIFKDMENAYALALRFKEKIMAAIDVKGGKVVHSGWLESTSLTAKEAIEALEKTGFSAFLVTNTERDGAMKGADASFYAPLMAKGRFIAAAGGVTTARDIKSLAEIGLDAAVVGKSLYEGGVTLREALDAAEPQP